MNEDEDGRCRLTGLLPPECACRNHRNSQMMIGNAKELKLMGRFTASYPGMCGHCGHSIAVEDECAFAREPGESGDIIVRWECCGKAADE